MTDSVPETSDLVEAQPGEPEHTGPWYRGITRYQWLVLFIASLGWVFDVFEGQIFVASMAEAMPSLVPEGTPLGRIGLYNNIALGAFLLGGALGGIGFGVLSDRIGRKRTLAWTIVFYSFFTFFSALSQEWWHLAGFRFLVALGVGGEWAVAAALVAEVFPKRARAQAGGIFHATSVIGTYLAVAAGVFIIGNPAILDWARETGGGPLGQLFDPETLPWRIGFALGVLPALLIIWIRMSLREPKGWEAARERSRTEVGQQMGTLTDLFRGNLLRRTLVGVSLAGIGLATFWGAHIYGKDMLRGAAEERFVEASPISTSPSLGDIPTYPSTADAPVLTAEQREAILAPHFTSLKRWEMLGMFLVTTGGGIGLLSFGWIAARLGRRKSFALFHLGGLVSALLVFQVFNTVNVLLVTLPFFGFLTLGMHAGYAIYFPELFPTRLRGTGTGFCFNAGRVMAAPVLFMFGWMQSAWGVSLTEMASWLSLLFLMGLIALAFAPETRGRELAD